MDTMFLLEKARVKEYENQSNINFNEDSKLAYSLLNTRFLNMEKNEESENTTDEFMKKRSEHDAVQRSIEDEWHKKTAASVKELAKDNHGDVRTKSYYRNYTLNQLEIFLKNNTRSKNSDKYNDVVTDLEVFNRVMSNANDKDYFTEGITLLKRLRESCSAYLEKRRSIFKSGRSRRAIIAQIMDKANEYWNNRVVEYKNSVMNRMDETIDGISVEDLNSLCQMDHNIIYNYLNGNIELTNEEVKKVDEHMASVMRKINNGKVDDNQSPCFTSKYFNAIGWSERKPQVANEGVFNRTVNNSPLKNFINKGYHTIDAQNGSPGAVFGRQFLGYGKNSRQYYSDGMYGKGTYQAYTSKGVDDKRAEDNSWEYGKSHGAVQFQLALNGNARTVRSQALGEMIEKKFASRFEKVDEFLKDKSHHWGTRLKVVGADNYSVYASLFGFNTIICQDGAGSYIPKNNLKEIVYVVTFDRSALNIREVYQVRNVGEGNSKSYYEMDYIDTLKEIDENNINVENEK